MPAQLEGGHILVSAKWFKDHERVVTITRDGVEYITNLYSNNNEADSCPLLHVSNSATHCHYLVAKYRHTVTECCLSRKKMMAQDWRHDVRETGYIPVHSVAEKLGSFLSMLCWVVIEQVLSRVKGERKHFIYQ